MTTAGIRAAPRSAPRADRISSRLPPNMVSEAGTDRPTVSG